jgi:hypothetical protein
MGSAQPDFGGIKKMLGIIYGRPWKNRHRKFFLELSDQLFGVEGEDIVFGEMNKTPVDNGGVSQAVKDEIWTKKKKTNSLRIPGNC